MLALANKHGGAHVDPELDDIYAELSRENSLERMRSSSAGWVPMPGPEHASERQIAHEFIRTFVPGYKPPVQPVRPGWVIGGFELVGEPVDLSNVGRNDPCPCKSGKKFKKCHGASQ